MSLQTTRHSRSEGDAHTLEVEGTLEATSVLLHLSRLPGMRVVAKKSWALTDDFEAYFSYKGRMFVLETPFVTIELTMLGQPQDEPVLTDVEEHIQAFSRWYYVLAPYAFLKFALLPSDAPQEVLALGKRGHV
jgi:hypothetical protein